MKKNYLRLLVAFVLCTLTAGLYTPALAGTGPDTEAANLADQNIDPIAATLDSLVNQQYIMRLNQHPDQYDVNGNFDNGEIPSYADDIYRKRIAKIQTPIPLAFNAEVRQYIDMYAAKKRGLTERVMGLANFYFPLYEQILDQQDLPLEFKYLSIVESALNPMAVSRVGATGLWQFMLGTGRLYNLKINSLVDERRDPVKSTQAACKYFKDMYGIYNDWLLVIAAYNCGAGNVNRAIARSGGKRTFWEICQYLPKETRGYVPAFIAITYIMNYTAEHNLSAVPPLFNYFEADTVLIDHKMTFREVAESVHVPVEMISYLNPMYKRGIIPEADEPQVLRLPSNKINTFLASMDNIYHQEEEQSMAFNAALESFDANAGATSSGTVKTIHQVKRGEQIQSIASRYSCSVSELKRWNRLKSTRLTTGQRLTVFVNKTRKKDGRLAAVSARPSTSQTAKVVSQPLAQVSNPGPARSDKQIVKSDEGKNLRTVYHIVQPGDTLWKIAQHYEGATVEQIKEINRMVSNDLKVGSKILVPVAG